MLIRITYSCDHVLGDDFLFLPTLLFITLLLVPINLYVLGAKDLYHSGPRTRQSMFDDGLAELDKALLLKLSDTAGGLEVRLRKDLSNLTTGSRSKYTNKAGRLQR